MWNDYISGKVIVCRIKKHNKVTRLPHTNTHATDSTTISQPRQNIVNVLMPAEASVQNNTNFFSALNIDIHK